MLRSSWPLVSSLSAAIPFAASRPTAVPGSVALLSRADVVPCKAATDLAKGRAWPDTEEVTGSNPVAPTSKVLASGNAVALLSRRRPSGDAAHFAVWARSQGCVPDEDRFPCLPSGPAGPDPLIHSLEPARPVATVSGRPLADRCRGKGGPVPLGSGQLASLNWWTEADSANRFMLLVGDPIPVGSTRSGAEV